MPSPDSYDDVRGHIAPVQEGILHLVSVLEQEYSTGNWDVVIDVVPPGSAFVSSEYDIAVSLVTRDDDSDCIDSYLGYSYTIYPKPVPAVVCSLDSRTAAEIGATAAHEFIHAIGIGHTFNIKGDMMCSVENGYPLVPLAPSPPAHRILTWPLLRPRMVPMGSRTRTIPSVRVIGSLSMAPSYMVSLNTRMCYGPKIVTHMMIWLACMHYYCVTWWDYDGFSSYDSCLVDPFAYFTYDVHPYVDVLWPEDCSAHDDLAACIDYYCVTWWGL